MVKINQNDKGQYYIESNGKPEIRNCPFDDCEWPFWSWKCKVWASEPARIVQEYEDKLNRLRAGLERIAAMRFDSTASKIAKETLEEVGQ